RSTKATSKVKAARLSETEEQREAMLQAQRARAAAACQAETDDQTRTRQQVDQARKAAQRQRQFDLHNVAFDYINNLDISQHKAVEIETMSVVCNHCSVKKWKDEPPGLCWNNGNVSLLPIEQPPEPLLSLMEGDTEKSRHFLSNIRKYNSCFQMTSFGASKQVNEPGHMPTLKIQGQVYQRTGLLWKSFRAYKTCSTSITIYKLLTRRR
uniref:Helitron helicase-like domain-containing protein n=1 Tax=Lepisosteus oculatus TaxID=7918 RepID=W5M5Q6_LEPOC